MAPSTPVNIILGTHTVGDKQVPGTQGIVHFSEDKDVKELLDTFYERGYRQLDTASLYPGSEVSLGRAGAPSRFTIHTKVHSGPPGAHEPAKLKQSVEKSLLELKTDSVETMFLHVPDRQTPFEDVAKTMDELAKTGAFKRVGLSNYAPDEVKRFLEICEQHGYTKPSVYQGHYNALVRGGEEALFPLLRQHNMSFFAYSAAAAGIFAEANPDSSRWKDDNQIGQIYSMIYSQPAVQAAVAKVREDALKHNIGGHAAALRWTAYHSILDGRYGDAIIFAVSKLSQLHSSLDAIEAGPLPDELAGDMSAVFATMGETAPPFHL
ncbi:hypothetical protein LTR78_008084 [Recurvomyces mirabilis]|uniref:NADP-dependent oxidoreductase domain-containing protein n=1 Tax=Recurvomyces mirabilis TaxID=574656 RepID=A0AAE0TV24_9PEZI|nr:hypothetical protein LTR78_008084 [Recurvomyces mirabilis]KAK5150811.1 hypothetical protein LTS14_009875 [Recurvomyces mirabilis]